MRTAPRHRGLLGGLAAGFISLAAAPVAADPPTPPRHVNGEVVYRAAGRLLAVGTAAWTAAGSQARPLTAPSRFGSDSEPAWSPNATKLAFTRTRMGNADIWMLEADGTRAARLTTEPSGETFPAWSADGGHITFTTDRAGSSDVWVMNTNGTGQAPLATGPGIERQASWSPDGTRIAFTSNRSGRSGIWVMNVDGSDQRELSRPGAFNSDPAWSPDSARIAFATGRRGATHIETVRSDDGSDRRVVTRGGGRGDRDPAWSPDGDQIAFTRGGRVRVAPAPDAFDQPAPAGALLPGRVSGHEPGWAPVPAAAPPETGEVTVTDLEDVSVKVPASEEFAPLDRPSRLDVGTEMDTRKGQLDLHAPAADATTTATVSLGRFTYEQQGSPETPVNVLEVARPAACATAGRAVAARVAPEYVGVRNRGGRWSVGGRHSTSGSHKTAWTTEERCNTTTTRVFEGEVTVEDLESGATVTVHAGECYSAPSRVPRAVPCPTSRFRPRR
jgi:hypothetical protein